MSPTAINAPNHHDSFALPVHSEGNRVRASVHPSARRGPEGGLIMVEGDDVIYDAEGVRAKFTDRGAQVTKTADGRLKVVKTEKNYEFFTKSKVGRVGLLLVGLGGNNGTTVLATHLANKHNVAWHTKNGLQQPNYIGSLVRASTIRLGTDPETGKDVFVPISEMLPMVHPNDFIIGGWDISGMPMDQAMERLVHLEYLFLFHG